MTHLAETVLSHDMTYPESPRWHDGRLWFSDVHAYAVKVMDPDGTISTVVGVPGRPAGLGFLPDGRLLIAGALDRLLHVWDGTALSVYADLREVTLGLLNDMVVDRNGKAFVSDTGFDLMAGEEPRAGQLIEVVDTPASGVSTRVVADDVMFPNGSSISDDGHRFWLAESMADRVSVFATDPDQPWRRLADHPVADFPDGLVGDADGGVWVALLRKGVFQHLTRDGAADQSIVVDGRLAIACTFAGEGRKQLILCSAETTMEQLSKGISAGVISVVIPQVPGSGLP